MTGNKGEWSEIYALLKVVSDKTLTAGDANLNAIVNLIFPVIKVLRQESDGTYSYSYDQELDLVVIKGDLQTEFRIPVVSFREKAAALLTELQKQHPSATFAIPEIETFVNSFNCRSIKAKSRKKSDINIVIHDQRIGATSNLGFSIKSQIGSASTLFNASQASNFIYKVAGANIGDTEITYINNIDTNSKIQDRVGKIIKNGAVLKFFKTENNVFQNNLVLIDSWLPHILAELIIMFNTCGENKLLPLVKMLEARNPLGYDMQGGHQFYAYKIKRLLTECALGMRSTEIWSGTLDATGGYLVVKQNGDILCYHIYNRNNFEDYLLNNTRLINPSSTRNNFGKLYKQNNDLLFNLNIQIIFLE